MKPHPFICAMKIGLFFGSFNPIHVGHLILANVLATHTDLDAVWLVVSPQNPFKTTASLLPAAERLHMASLAVDYHDRIRVSNVEFSLPQPSYTADTLAYLEAKYPTYQFALLMGEDNLPTLPKWKNHEVLLARYPIYVYPRPGTPRSPLHEHPAVRLVEAPLLDISATYIRQCVAAGKSITFMVPEAVETYIKYRGFWLK